MLQRPVRIAAVTGPARLPLDDRAGKQVLKIVQLDPVCPLNP